MHKLYKKTVSKYSKNQNRRNFKKHVYDPIVPSCLDISKNMEIQGKKYEIFYGKNVYAFVVLENL